MKTTALTAIIVDDEELARSLIREYLSSHPEIKIVAECANGFEAVKAVTELKPELMFLDIQMPKLSGFEVIELLDESPEVIFVTAFDQYAVKAFDVHAVDYLLKPFGKERFDEALHHAVERIRSKEPIKVKAVVAEAKQSGQPLERILIKEGSKVLVIHADKLDYIEAQDDYISVRAEGKSHLKMQRLSALELLLDDRRFVRIHRSYILNIERLSKIELYAKDSRTAILKDGTQLPVSRSGYDRLKELL
ncbi:MAG: response regulator [Bacteriovoracaceae bacterium]|nr:response regulator [Bacteroidota bacterium]